MPDLGKRYNAVIKAEFYIVLSWSAYNHDRVRFPRFIQHMLSLINRDVNSYLYWSRFLLRRQLALKYPSINQIKMVEEQSKVKRRQIISRGKIIFRASWIELVPWFMDWKVEKKNDQPIYEGFSHRFPIADLNVSARTDGNGLRWDRIPVDRSWTVSNRIESFLCRRCPHEQTIVLTTTISQQWIIGLKSIWWQRWSCT